MCIFVYMGVCMCVVVGVVVCVDISACAYGCVGAYVCLFLHVDVCVHRCGGVPDLESPHKHSPDNMHNLVLLVTLSFGETVSRQGWYAGHPPSGSMVGYVLPSLSESHPWASAQCLPLLHLNLLKWSGARESTGHTVQFLFGSPACDLYPAHEKGNHTRAVKSKPELLLC